MSWLSDHMAWRRQHARPRPLLGFCRDWAVLLFLFWCLEKQDATWLWLGFGACFACLAYDVRLMWIDAGKKLGR